MSFYGASAAGDGGGAFLGGGGFPRLETDLEAVVRPVVHPVARLMAMVLVVAVAARPMEVSIPRRFDPAGGPPVDTFQCERCTGVFSTHLRRLCVSCKFSCCNDCCRDPLRVCVVCLERQTDNPSGPGDSGPGASRGDGSASDAKKAKCKSFRLEPESEPEPAQLRRWIVEMKDGLSR